jgi:hypothetical protein
MAILLLEIRDTFVHAGTDENPEVGQALMTYREDKAKRRDLEDSMTNLLRAYARMISEDLVTEIPSVRRRRMTLVHGGTGTHPINSPTKSYSGNHTTSATPHPYPPPSQAFSSSDNASCGDGQMQTRPSSQGLNSIQEETSVELTADSNFLFTGDSSRISFETPRKKSPVLQSHSYSKKPAAISSINADELTASDDDDTEVDSSKTQEEPNKLVLHPRKQSEGTSSFDDGEKDSFHSAKSADSIGDQDANRLTSQDSTNRSNSDEAGGVHGRKRPPKIIPTIVPSPQNPFSSARREQLAHQVSQKKDQLAEEAKRFAADMKQRRQHVVQEITDRVDPNREGNTQKEFQELTNALFEGGRDSKPVAASVSNFGPGDMLRVMRNAVETRDDAQLQFLAQIFKEGSVSQLLVQSHSRLVWMNDWYPLKDLTYAIAVDTRLKRVLVVFRGAITAEDWRTVMQYKFETIPNPVKDDFEGKKDKIRVYMGFYEYLFRVRKDTGTTKYSEIASLAHKYGIEKIGKDYKLFVTGHSLGGALTNFFCFFASTEERFTRNGPVQAIAFAGPYCGGHSFADSFRHQERMKKLQFIRVANNNDMVPRLPTNFRIGRRGCRWRHVGIGVTMPRVPWFGKWKPLMHYYGKEQSWIGSTIHGYQRNVLFHAPLLRPWRISKMHTLFELQDRLMYGEMHSNPGGDFTMLNQTMDELYKGLEENDFMQLKGMKTKQKWL